MSSNLNIIPRSPVSVRRPSQRPEVEATRLRILRAAERLFAVHGFSGASLREIAIAAGQGNNNAAQYHFGNRERLIDAIFHQRLDEMEPERLSMLAEAEAADRLNDVPSLLAIMAMPHLSMCDEHGQHPHAAFLLHYMLRQAAQGPAGRWRALYAGAPAMSRTIRLLLGRLDTLPGDIAETRIMLSTMMFLNLLTQHDAATPSRAKEEMLARHATDTIAAMATMLCGPCAATE